MKLSYLPGCTLKTKAKGLDDSTVAAAAVLGVELEELPRWNCCGTVYAFADDDLMHQIAPVRNLVRAQEQGADKLVTVCSFCYNTLKRASLLVKNDQEKLKTINMFMDEEPDYENAVEVVHLLEVLRDDVGWEEVAKKVSHPLKDVKIAAYYGCTLNRPREIAIENPAKPTVLLDLVKAIGAGSVDFPDADTCCGSYQAVANPDIALNRTRDILNSARSKGAEMIITSCPLCESNLGRSQKQLASEEGFTPIPVVYFTQLLALALGLDPEVCHFELNATDPRPFLESKGLLPVGAGV